MANQLTIKVLHCYSANFDRDKLFLEKSVLTLLTTNQKWVELISTVSYV